MPGRQTSCVWEHFVKLDTEEIVVCKHCKLEMKYCKSTGSMLKHLKSKHSHIDLVITPKCRLLPRNRSRSPVQSESRYKTEAPSMIRRQGIIRSLARSPFITAAQLNKNSRPSITPLSIDLRQMYLLDPEKLKMYLEEIAPGYKMLDKLCPACDTILLQNREGANYCVACEELESETSKDDPAISSTAAAASLLEHSQRQTVNDDQAQFSADSDIQVNEQSTTSHPPECGDTPNARQQPLAKVPAAEDNSRTMYEALQIVRRKIIKMASQLSDDTAIDETVKLCEAIKSCAECATAMQRLV